MSRNSTKIWPCSRSSKVIDLGVNPYLLPFLRYWRLKLENRWFPPTLVWGTRSVNPLEFGDEIWRQKTRILGLPGSEEITTLAFFVLTQYRRVTDGQTDRHVAIAITLASIASRGINLHRKRCQIQRWFVLRAYGNISLPYPTVSLSTFRDTPPQKKNTHTQHRPRCRVSFYLLVYKYSTCRLGLFKLV